MPIKKRALEQYLARDLEDLHALKLEPKAVLETILRQISPQVHFYTTPWLHQKVCVVLGCILSGVLFFLDMGLGKTKIILDILTWRIRTGKVKRVLILVPNVVNIQGWLDEIQIHAPKLKAVGLFGGSSERAEQLQGSGNQLFILNYAGLVALCRSKNSKSSNSKWALDTQKVSDLASMFQAVVFDESQALKNWNSLTYKICNQLTDIIEVRYALTGTPFGRDPHDLWAQFYIIDKGETLGGTLGLFRAGFFKQKINYWGGYEYVFQKSMESLLHTFLSNRSIRYNVHECKSLPPKIYIKKRVPFPEEIDVYYKKVVDTIKGAKGDYQLLRNAFVNLRQLASGFLSIKIPGEEDSEKIEIEFESPKMEELVELCTSLPASCKAIVFHEYIHSGRRISEALTKAKVGHTRLFGGTTDKPAALRKFLKDDKCTVFVCNNKSGSAGLNLQIANYVIFYETPVSPIVRVQAEARAYRSGQVKTVFIIDLIVIGSIEEKLLGYIKSGKDLFKALIEGKEDFG